MFVSFKIAKKGKRYCPKPVVNVDSESESDNEVSKACMDDDSASYSRKLKEDAAKASEDVPAALGYSISEHEVSFILNIYEDGYTLGKPVEIDQDPPKSLLPYDRAAESLFKAIECGQLPGNLPHDIQCNFMNGSVVCEVRDYRECASSTNGHPVINRVQLKMTFENVVKNIKELADDSWTYSNFLEVESRILHAMHPKLDIDPTPNFDRLFKSTVVIKLNVDFGSLRRKRLRRPQDATLTSDSRSRGKRVCTDQVLQDDSSICGKKVCTDQVLQDATIAISDSRIHGKKTSTDQVLQDATIAISDSRIHRKKASTDQVIQDETLTVSDSRIHGKKVCTDQVLESTNISNGVPGNISGNMKPQNVQENQIPQNIVPNCHNIPRAMQNQDGQMQTKSGFNKTVTSTPMGREGIQLQKMPHSADSILASDLNRKKFVSQPQEMASGIQNSPHQIAGGVMNQNQSSGRTLYSAGHPKPSFCPNEDQSQAKRLDRAENSRSKCKVTRETDLGKLNQKQSQPEQPSRQVVLTFNFPYEARNNHSQDKLKRKSRQKRKLDQITGPYSESGGRGSGEPQVGAVPATAVTGPLQKEKAVIIDGASSLTSNANDSVQRQDQPRESREDAAKSGAYVCEKIPETCRFGSPASADNNNNVPLKTSSPAVGTPLMADEALLRRFSKIMMVHKKYMHDVKTHKVDDDYAVKNPKKYSHQELSSCLADSNNEDLEEDGTFKLSKSVVGGNMNISKMKTIHYIKTEDEVPEDQISLVPKLWTKMFMSEKQNGSVAMLYGAVPDGDFLSVEHTLPTLPNAHFADLLAAQQFSLMIREGCEMEGNVQPKPICESEVHTDIEPIDAVISRMFKSVFQWQQQNEASPGQPSNELRAASCMKAATSRPKSLLVNSKTSQGITSSGPVHARQHGSSDDNLVVNLQQDKKTAPGQPSKDVALPFSVNARKNPLQGNTVNSELTRGKTSGFEVLMGHAGTSRDSAVQLQQPSERTPMQPSHEEKQILQNLRVISEMSRGRTSDFPQHARLAGTSRDNSAIGSQQHNKATPGRQFSEVQPLPFVDAAGDPSQNVLMNDGMPPGLVSRVPMHARSQRQEPPQQFPQNQQDKKAAPGQPFRDVDLPFSVNEPRNPLQGKLVNSELTRGKIAGLEVFTGYAGTSHDSAVQFQPSERSSMQQSNEEKLKLQNLRVISEMSRGLISDTPHHARHAGTSRDNSAIGSQQHHKATPGQPFSEVQPPLFVDAARGPSQNVLMNDEMPPGIASRVPMHARPQKQEPHQQFPQNQQLQQPITPQLQKLQQQSQIQQQYSNFQRPPTTLPSNPVLQGNALEQNSSMFFGGNSNNMASDNLSQLQFQMLQQAQQQQQAEQQKLQEEQLQQRNMLMGFRTSMGLENMGYNMNGPPGFGIGGGASEPKSPISGGMGSPFPSNVTDMLNEILNSGDLTPQQAASLRSRMNMSRNQASMLGGPPQSNITGIKGSIRQTPPAPPPSFSMISQSPSPGNMNTQSNITGITGSSRQTTSAPPPSFSMLRQSLNPGNMNTRSNITGITDSSGQTPPDPPPSFSMLSQSFSPGNMNTHSNITGMTGYSRQTPPAPPPSFFMLSQSSNQGNMNTQSSITGTTSSSRQTPPGPPPSFSVLSPSFNPVNMNTQSNTTGITGSSRQTPPGPPPSFSMFGQSFNPGNISTMQQGPARLGVSTNMAGGEGANHNSNRQVRSRQQQQRDQSSAQMNQGRPQANSRASNASTSGRNQETRAASSQMNRQTLG